jgi:hypothetical protein
MLSASTLRAIGSLIAINHLRPCTIEGFGWTLHLAYQEPQNAMQRQKNCSVGYLNTSKGHSICLGV